MTSIDFRKAQFLTSAATVNQCPADFGNEVAFAGRSNAGKSSAINRLTGNSKLARTSKTPGRTRLLNFFSLSEQQRLVDLPGYGYAKVPEAMKREWEQQLEAYLMHRRSLRGLVLLMDVRHPLQAFDRTFIEWGAASAMPMQIVLTKADKLKKGPAKNQLLGVRKELQGYGDLVSVQLFSALKGDGKEELQGRLEQWLNYDESMDDDDEDILVAP